VTLVYIAITAAVAFVIGFLAGDRRGVREANAILDANMRELFKAIGDDRQVRVDGDEEQRKSFPLH
jgi:hypothetical protein